MFRKHSESSIWILPIKSLRSSRTISDSNSCRAFVSEYFRNFQSKSKFNYIFAPIQLSRAISKSPACFDVNSLFRMELMHLHPDSWITSLNSLTNGYPQWKISHLCRRKSHNAHSLLKRLMNSHRAFISISKIFVDEKYTNSLIFSSWRFFETIRTCKCTENMRIFHTKWKHHQTEKYGNC